MTYKTGCVGLQVTETQILKHSQFVICRIGLGLSPSSWVFIFLRRCGLIDPA